MNKMEELEQEEEEDELSLGMEGESNQTLTDIEGYVIKYPLPKHTDDSICRDEFLQRHFESCELKKSTSKRGTKQSERSNRSRARSTIGTRNMEGFAIMRRIKQSKVALEDHDESSEADKKIVSKATLTPLERRMIYKFFLVRFRNAAVEYLSVRLKKRLEIFVNVWSAQTTEIPHNLFKWSASYFKARTSINQLYLDVLTIERDSTELNCSKFCTDVNELIDILDAIREDVREDRDICDNSLKLMQDMNFEVHAKWIKELEHIREEKEKLATDAIHPHDGRDKDLRNNARISQVQADDGTIEVESRYRINWLRSTGDQYMMRVEGKEKALQNKLNELKLTIRENSLAFESTELVSQLQIDRYRVSIAKWEEQLEMGMEELELKGNVIRNQLAKAKDDLKLYMERIEMFRRRVAEVLLQEEDEERSSRRKFRKSLKPVVLPPPKLMMKAKKNKKK